MQFLLQFDMEHTVIISRWPAKASQISFYDVMIKDHPYAQHFTKFEEIKAKMATNQKAEAVAMLQDTTLIEDNFAQVGTVAG